MDRGSTGLSEEAGASRIFIQLVNGGALCLMLGSILNQQYPKTFKWIKVLMAILVFYAVVYLYYPKGIQFTTSHYIRFLTNLVGFMFFYKAYFRIEGLLLNRFMQVYIVTLMVSSVSKILSSSMFSLENLGAGDTASISLVFLIPLFFIFFNTRTATILYLIAFAFAIISLRRTCIIAFAVSIPFIYNSVKQNIRFLHIFYVAILASLSSLYLWQYFGNSLIIRFSEMTSGSGESMGSGRSIFYAILLSDFFENPNSYFLGNGLNSVWAFYYSKHLYYLPHAHNDFLEIIYTFGFLGIFIWLAFIFCLAKEKWDKSNSKSYVKLYYMAICLYLIVAMASGTILRIEMIPFVMSISFLLASKKKAAHEKNLLLLQRIKHADVLVAKNSLF